MKTLLMTMACLMLAGNAMAQKKREKEPVGLKTSEVRGCYVIKVNQMFFKADLHLSIPGDGTFSFLADTKNQGPMAIPCTGTSTSTEYTSVAHVSCVKMLAVSKAKSGKPYDWEKNFRLDIDLSKAKREGNLIRKVSVKNTQGSNGATTKMTADLEAEACRSLQN